MIINDVPLVSNGCTHDYRALDGGYNDHASELFCKKCNHKEIYAEPFTWGVYDFPAWNFTSDGPLEAFRLIHDDDNPIEK